MNRFVQICIVFLVVVFVLVVAFVLRPEIANKGVDCQIKACAMQNNALHINAGGAVLIEQHSGRVLWEQNQHKRMPMASTTKIFTALTVLNHCDINDVVDVCDEAVGVEGSSIYLKQGDRLTVYDLLCGLMLRSGNDSAVALAMHCGGSVEAFCHMANDMCADMGLKDTNLVNPHGLHEANHYTTAYDLAKVTCRALSNEVFAKIVSSKSAVLHYLNNDTTSKIYNKNKSLSNYNGADGVKTGYTTVAGKCFVGSATRNNMQLVSVVLDCPDMWNSSNAMLDYGFNNYTMTVIIPQNAIFTVQKDNITEHYYSQQCFCYPLDKTEIDNLHINIADSSGKMYCQICNGDSIIGSVELCKIT